MLDLTAKRNASDLHLIVGHPPMIRVDGVLQPIPQEAILTDETTEGLIFALLTNEQKDMLLANKEIDFSYALGDARFRVNVYFQKTSLAAALRYLPQKIRNVEELFLPKIYHQFVNLRQGFILVTGPTGHGKSTTLAAVLNEINQTRDVHIVTIEDPIEYVYPKSRAIVSQRDAYGYPFMEYCAAQRITRGSRCGINWRNAGL